MPVLRLGNRLLARLSRASEPRLCAGVLLFLAKVFPLNERSGLNITVGGLGGGGVARCGMGWGGMGCGGEGWEAEDHRVCACKRGSG
jgi:hypothetical protein